MYHVIGTIAVLTILYLISLFLYRSGYYDRQFHRDLWNIILASAFIVTALAGLFLALQVNYHWNVTRVELIRRWHVEFGTGMAVTGIFHFIWHFSYYTRFFSGRKDPGEIRITGDEVYKGNPGVNLFIVGFVSSSVQLLLLREIMNITGGYELISGIFLGSWLIASSAGSFLSVKSGLFNLSRINLIFSLSPLISTGLLILLSRLFLATGQTPSFLVSLVYTFLVISPFCFISGFTFVKLIRVAHLTNHYIPGKSFAIETTGGIFSGILISILTAGILNTYQLLFLIVILTNTWVVLNFFLTKRYTGIVIRVCAVILSALVITSEIDKVFRSLLLPGVSITHTFDTPYGNITEGIYNKEKSKYYNHRLISYASDVIEKEEDIHYAMLQADDPKRIIIISGNFGSRLNEIEKYEPREIIYIERDPGLLSDIVIPDSLKNKVIIAEDDAFNFIRKSETPADIVLLLVPPPSTLLLNRFYTTGFFESVKNILSPGGIFMCTPGAAESYYNPESLRMYSSVYNSLENVFGNVIPVAGSKLYFLASDKPLNTSVCSLAIRKNINNIYVGPDYLSDDLIALKSGEYLSVNDTTEKENRLEHPVAAMGYQSYIFSRDTSEKTSSFALIILIFAVPAFTICKRNMLMYSGAASLAGFEIILLLTLQLIAGNMYQLTGMIIAGLMTGLATGSIAGWNFILTLSLRNKGLILSVFYFLFSIFFTSILEIDNIPLAISMLIIISFFPAFITGNIFRTLSGNNSLQVYSIYGADLAGSALGFILLSGLAVPAIGIRNSILLISLIILAGAIFGTSRINK